MNLGGKLYCNVNVNQVFLISRACNLSDTVFVFATCLIVSSVQGVHSCKCSPECKMYSPFGCSLECCLDRESDHISRQTDKNEEFHQFETFRGYRHQDPFYELKMNANGRCQCNVGCFYPALQPCAKCCMNELTHQPENAEPGQKFRNNQKYDPSENILMKRVYGKSKI